MNKFHIETLGCMKNEYDSEVLAKLLEDEGYLFTDDLDDAEIIIVNTCGFINDAKIESIDKIFDMSRDKKDNSVLVVTGCLSQRYYKTLVDDMPEVDLFIGVEEYYKLPELLNNLPKEKYYIEKPKREPLPYNERKLVENPYSATLKIAEGCNNACAFCIIPRIRGPFRSKSIEDIIKEATMLANAGTKEIILIAQDVTYYGMDIYGEFMLPKLLTELCKVDKIHWIRLMYCYEERITDELIEVIAKEDKICNYIDIPIQHISNKVLKSMNRASTSDSIRNTLKRLRDNIEDIHIRTTLLVGFPGETEEDYEELIDFVEETKFDRLGVFGFSNEENTKAFKMDGHLDDETTEERVNGIMKCQLDISLEHNQGMIGNIYEVIVDEKDTDGSYLGRTRYDAPEIDNSVIFTSKRGLSPGQFVNVEINDAYDYDLVGVEV
ncbi:MAG: 30S ribosomal protein S12 methylthiotransferase RimO [Peptostreptococcaceae bacterium]|nr:30S ribosomal protein S12 methylthiotransferase RimO [Peptostreptococcaceae bacterium]